MQTKSSVYSKEVPHARRVVVKFDGGKFSTELKVRKSKILRNLETFLLQSLTLS
jgi:hypothetical protein